jgi:hypothetical protein
VPVAVHENARNALYYKVLELVRPYRTVAVIGPHLGIERMPVFPSVRLALAFCYEMGHKTGDFSSICREILPVPRVM